MFKNCLITYFQNLLYDPIIYDIILWSDTKNTIRTNVYLQYNYEYKSQNPDYKMYNQNYDLEIVKVLTPFFLSNNIYTPNLTIIIT